MIDIDWSKAPEGTTHYQPESADFYAAWIKVDGDWLMAIMDDGIDSRWGRAGEYADKKRLLIPRPSSQWNGSGLPPVGTVCEVDGEKVVIVAHHCNGIHAIYAESISDGLLYYGDPNEFRPIRTPEQIAADEREAAICNMARIALKGSDNLINKQWLENLYDDGYRKP